MNEYPDFMGARQVLAANLVALMEHAERTGGEYSTQYALGEADGVNISQSSMSRLMACRQSVGIDKLEAIARAYGIQAWHLLLPKLEPGNPPVILVTEAERELYRRIGEVGKAYSALGDPDGGNTGSPANPSTPGPSKKRRLKRPAV